MKADIKAPRGADSRDFVSKLTLTAFPESDVDKMKLALIAYALFPCDPKQRDKMFDRWLVTRITAYCKRNKVHIERSPK